MERVGVALIAAGGAALAYALLQMRQQQAAQPRTPCGNRVPACVHARLPEAATRHRRVLIVGDVHGCPDELQVQAGGGLELWTSAACMPTLTAIAGCSAC